jgi:cytochrome c oxidase subunit 4
MAETQPAHGAHTPGTGTHTPGTHEHGTGKDDHAGHHGDALPQYIMVFTALMLLTAVTVWVSYLPLSGWSAGHLVVAMTVSVIKATLVVLIFMHVWHSGPMIKVIIFGSLLTLSILLSLTYADYWSRSISGIGREDPAVRKSYEK